MVSDHDFYMKNRVLTTIFTTGAEVQSDEFFPKKIFLFKKSKNYEKSLGHLGEKNFAQKSHDPLPQDGLKSCNLQRNVQLRMASYRVPEPFYRLSR